MIWTMPLLPILISLLSITSTADARNHFPSSPGSFYTSILTNLLQSLRLTHCALSDTTSLPQSTLPTPSEGLSLKFITLGRGTQNYTCATNANTSAPEAAGATATLFDISCLAALDAGANTDEFHSSDQSLLHAVPDMLKPIPLGSTDFLATLVNRFTGQNLAIGKHYFTNEGVPFFDLRGFSPDDWIAAKKDSEADAPAKPGYGITGDAAWLKLKGVEGGIREVYRVHTAGGDPPATCEGMSEVFTVDYSAEYWLYG
ncbi:DUF3455 domain-containing protein [Aspergillus lucknowensis]|uniref:Malate dehydrogenase n=1 Tax=Aspergillus lucknowensis TaxID=176173 RepID=A0ABR4M2Z9_9EURO